MIRRIYNVYVFDDKDEIYSADNGKLRSQQTNKKSGLKQIMVRDIAGHPKLVYVHRLKAMAFGLIPFSECGGTRIVHKDGDVTNNMLDNLEVR